MHNRYFLHEECSIIYNGKRRNARIINVEYNGNDELTQPDNEEYASVSFLLHLKNTPAGTDSLRIPRRKKSTYGGRP